MADARLQAQLLEAKKEIQRLKEIVSPATTPTIHKDLLLISVIPKWSGSDAIVTLEEFLESIESSGRIGRWTENDQREVAVLKLTGSAKLFYQCCDELHEPGATWQRFKQAFRRRYKDVHTDQYHFTKLQTARQAQNERPQQFADRCKSLAQKVMLKSDDSQIQRIHRENADRMLLASFVSGLIGVPGRQVRFSHPQSLEEAFNLALAVQEAERQERFNGGFYTRSEKLVRLLSEPLSRPDSGSKNRRKSGELRADGQERLLVRLGQSPRKIGKREQKLPYAVTSAMARGISRENAQPCSGRRRNSLIHQAGKTLPNVRSVRTCLAISEKQGLRETRARRRR